MPPLSTLTREIYRYVLAHLETEKARLDTLIASISNTKGLHFVTGKASPAPTDSPKASPKKTIRKKRVMSAEAKAHISEVQKKRWTAFRKSSNWEALHGKKVKPVAVKKAKKAVKKDNSDIPI